MDSDPEDESLSQAVERQLVQYFALHGDVLPPPGLYSRILTEIERPLLVQTLAATKGNQLKAAQVLGINRNTLRKKLKALQLLEEKTPRKRIRRRI